MMLLAGLNPDFTGVESDDGFRMGQFTGATANLLFIATLFGVLGGGVYFVVRGLMIGPRWFQLVSISVGPAVVVGSQIVHSDGVDFTLQPALLAVALFVLIPGIYAVLLALLADRWLEGTSFFATGPMPVVVLPLLLWAPIAPVLVVLAIGLAAYEAMRRSARGKKTLARPVWPRLARAALALIFAVALVDLISDAATVA